MKTSFEIDSGSSKRMQETDLSICLEASGLSLDGPDGQPRALTGGFIRTS
jgi:hypothetical protein